MINQKRTKTALIRAIEKKNVRKARDLVTLLFSTTEEERDYKRNAYRHIATVACETGDIDTALETVPFGWGENPSECNLTQPIMRAVQRGKLEVYIICKECIDADICPKELARLLRKMKDKVQARKFLPFLRFQPAELNLVKAMLRRIHPNDLTLEERVIIRLET